MRSCLLILLPFCNSFISRSRKRCLILTATGLAILLLKGTSNFSVLGFSQLLTLVIPPGIKLDIHLQFKSSIVSVEYSSSWQPKSTHGFHHSVHLMNEIQASIGVQNMSQFIEDDAASRSDPTDNVGALNISILVGREAIHWKQNIQHPTQKHMVPCLRYGNDSFLK